MKTILVATDFSASAQWPVDYALHLAQQSHARLVVVHAFDPLPANAPAQEWLMDTGQGQYYIALRKLGELREQLLRASHSTVEVAVVARPEAPGTALLDEVRKQQADLLVMGLTGDHPRRARSMGSLATDLIPRTPVPLLVVPPGVRYQPPHTLLLAVDLSQAINALALDSALRFARQVGAALDVVCVDDEPDAHQRQAAQHLRRLLRHYPHTFTFLEGLDLAVALDTYLHKHHVDGVVLLPHPHSRLRTWLIESNTQEVARLATVPVLAAV